MRKFIYFIIFFLLISCEKEVKKENKINIFTTTSHISDMVNFLIQNTNISNNTLLPIGSDPHTYKANIHDIQKLNQADYIIYHGFHLEKSIQSLIEKNYLNKSKAITDFIDDKLIIYENDFNKDPHIWNNLLLWETLIDPIADILINLDVEKKDIILNNAQNYRDKVLEIHEWAVSKVNEIPSKNRILISSHDAFSYLKVYGFKTYSVIGLSTENEPKLQDFQNIIKIVKKEKIKTIFLENQLSNSIGNTLVDNAQNAGIELYLSKESLFGDDIGTTEENNTHLKAFQYNINIIVKNLK